MQTMPVELNSEFLTTREAAAELGCTRTRVIQLLLAGELPGQKAGPRCWLIPASDVRQYSARPRRRGGRPRIGD